MALTANTKIAMRYAGQYYEFPVATGTTTFIGSMLALDTNGRFVLAGAAGAVTAAVGKATQAVVGDNTLTCRADPGIYCLTNSAGGEAVSIADRGRLCYAVDDNTVCRRDAGASERPMGVVYDVDTDGVWVQADHNLCATLLGTVGQAPGFDYLVRGASTGNVANLAAFTVANDGITFVAGERVLLKDQGDATENGIYVVGVVGAGTAPLTRALDFDGTAEIVPNAIVRVSEGTLGADTLWQLTTDAPIVVGTSDLVFTAAPLGFGAAGAMVAETPDVAANAGVSALAARIDHVHACACGAAGAIAPDDAAAEGVAVTFARSDHVHGFACAAPPVTAAGDGVLAAPAEGVAVTHARSDHAHALGLPAATGEGQPFYIYHTFTAGGGGADDVTIYNADCPYALRILDCGIQVATAGAGGSTLTVRDTAGGGGAALSSALSTAATAYARTALTTAMGQVAAGGSLVLRRTDNTCVGEFYALCMRTA